MKLRLWGISVAVVAALCATKAIADLPFSVIDVRERGDGGTVVAEVKLDALASEVRQKRGDLLMQASPSTFRDIDLIKFRFVDLHPIVTDARVRKAAAPNEVGVVVTARVHARRLKRRYVVAGPWDEDGSKDIAELQLLGRIEVASGEKGLEARMRLDSMMVTVLISDFEGTRLAWDTGGRVVKTAPLNFPEFGVTAVRVVDVRPDNTARVELDFE